MNYRCEVCKQKNMAIIQKPQSKEEEKKGFVLRFVVCRKCDPVMASFEHLDNSYQELQNTLKKDKDNNKG